MADEILVHHAELSLRGDEPFYVISIEDERREDFVGLRGHIMPADTFESRAAEYELDPESPTFWDDVFQITLFNKTNHDTIEDHLADPDHLFNAPTVAHARAAALGRARKYLGKRRLRGLPGHSEHRLMMARATSLMTSEDEDPLEFIKRTAPMSPEHMYVKREFVRRQRDRVRMRREKLDADNERVRDMRLRPRREGPEQLAQRLLGHVPEYWTDDGLSDEQREARFDFTARDVNDIPRNRLPPREGAPSKYL